MGADTELQRIPRLRGLDPSLMLGVLGRGAPTTTPRITGWIVLGVAGSGGSGIVWHARRESDGTEAAIKVSSPDDPETVERLEGEIESLRSLHHPNIVGLVDAGPLTGDADDGGGLYLAMEFVDGPTLSQEIPEGGLPPATAFRWFRDLAVAVAHAHDTGILHRDLKPGNVLLSPDGRVRVGDFGLARPVHRRVHQLSLTRAGLVAGTAEYLPPEAYRADYQPDRAGDLFALGVMLHEMLTGTPPRGAWLPASSRPGVDVRVDGIIARAMDPNPARRWPDARTMVAALDAILASPPRWFGSPLLGPAVRAADALWSVAGTLLVLAGMSSLLGLDRADILLPLDLTNGRGRLTGGFQALVVMLTVSLPLALWQMARLFRFRHIPLREALPSPFGLKPGPSRVTAVLVGIGQVVSIWLPALIMLTLYLGTGLSWLTADSPVWLHGLAVTPMNDRQIISPWLPGSDSDGFWLWETYGPPTHGFAETVDRIPFLPCFEPVFMMFAGLIVGLNLLLTTGAACRCWWQRRLWLRSAAFAAATAALTTMIVLAWARELRAAKDKSNPARDPFTTAAHMTRDARGLAAFLLGSEQKASADFKDHLHLYAATVAYRDHGTIARESIPEWRARDRPHALAAESRIYRSEHDWNPDNVAFSVRAWAMEALDGLDGDSLCGADHLSLELTGTVTLAGHTTVRAETLVRHPLYRTDGGAAATPEDAARWLADLRFALALPGSDSARMDRMLNPLFLPLPESARGAAAPPLLVRIPDHRSAEVQMLDTVFNHTEPSILPTVLPLPGGVTRVTLTGSGERATRSLEADLIHTGGAWRCIRIRFPVRHTTPHPHPERTL